MSLYDDLTALTKLKQSRNNLGLINEQLTELQELADNAEEALSALANGRERVEELAGVLEGAAGDNPLIAWAPEVLEAAQKLLEALPPEDADSIEELLSDAQNYAEEYETSLDDSDYSADDREEVWGNLLDLLEQIAEAVK